MIITTLKYKSNFFLPAHSLDLYYLEHKINWYGDPMSAEDARTNICLPP